MRSNISSIVLGTLSVLDSYIQQKLVILIAILQFFVTFEQYPILYQITVITISCAPYNNLVQLAGKVYSPTLHIIVMKMYRVPTMNRELSQEFRDIYHTLASTMVQWVSFSMTEYTVNPWERKSMREQKICILVSTLVPGTELLKLSSFPKLSEPQEHLIIFDLC